MNLIEIFNIILIHWIADFVLQTDQQAKGKSKNWSDLLSHTFIYTSCWLIIGHVLKVTNIIYLEPGYLTLFALITFITHTITDYFTSRLNAKLWSEGKVHGSIWLQNFTIENNTIEELKKEREELEKEFFKSKGELDEKIELLEKFDLDEYDDLMLKAHKIYKNLNLETREQFQQVYKSLL